MRTLSDFIFSFRLWFHPVRAAVLSSSPPPPLPLSVNTPDSDNLLGRSELRAWTVFRLTCSLHSDHCSLLPEGKSVKVYFTSEHSFMELRLRNVLYLCKYIKFKFTSRTLQCPLHGTYMFASNWNHGGISCDVHFPGHLRSNRTTSEAIRETYKMFRAGGREDWNWGPLC